MSNPTDPPVPNPDAQPTEAYGQPPVPNSDPQPTEAYGQPVAPPPPYAEQPTQAYPDAQPTQAYGQPVYGTPAPAPKAPDTRPKTLAWIALGAGILGFILVLVAFIPLLWVSLILALVGGVLLLGALVIGIIALASKKHGGKGLSIGAIIVSVVGGLAWIGAITWAIVVIGLASAGGNDIAASPEPTAVESEAPSDTDTDTETGGDDVAAGAYDEAAYLAQVRPELVAIMQEVDPSLTEETISEVFPDETLVSTGSSLLSAGDAGRDVLISSLSESGLFDEAQATRFYDAILDGARQHLVE
ncbi:MAG: hypothetical protein ABWY03_10180 [Microbacterium sp.]